MTTTVMERTEPAQGAGRRSEMGTKDARARPLRTTRRRAGKLPGDALIERSKIEIQEVEALKKAIATAQNLRADTLPLRVRLGQVLSRARVAAGRTQATAAEACNMSLKYYGEIERGEANSTMDVVERIANMFNVDLFEELHLQEPISEGVRRELLLHAEKVVQHGEEMARWLKAIAQQ